MGYTIDDKRVRIDLFKPSGKWAYHGSVNMDGEYDGDVHTALTQAMSKGGIEGLSTDWKYWVADGGFIICLSPYHKFSHPICINKHALPTRGR